MIKRLRGISAVSAAFFRRLTDPVWRVLFYSLLQEMIPSAVIAVSIRQGHVDVLRAQRLFLRYFIKGVKTYNYEEGIVPSPDEVASAAVAAMKEFGVKRSDAVLLVPKSWIILKFAELPAAASASLKNVIEYEFDRFTPFSASEALYDYCAENVDGEKIDILLAAAREASVREYLEKLSAKMLPVRRLDFDLSAVSTFLGFISGINTFIFVEISASACGGGFVKEGGLKSVVLHEFKTKDDNKKAAETEEVIYRLRKELDVKGRQVPVIIAFSEELSQFKNIMTSRAKIPFRTPADFGRRKRGLSGLKLHGAAPAGGALQYLWPKAQGFNLLSGGLRSRPKMPFLVSLLLSIVLAGALLLYLFIPIDIEGERLAKINSEISRRKSEVMSIEKTRSDIAVLSKKIELAADFRQDRNIYIDIVRELTQRMPQNAWLTRVRIAGSQVNIEGYAGSATALIQLLETSKHFKNVEFSSPTYRDVQMNMDRFQIKMELRERMKEAAVNEKK